MAVRRELTQKKRQIKRKGSKNIGRRQNVTVCLEDRQEVKRGEKGKTGENSKKWKDSEKM